MKAARQQRAELDSEFGPTPGEAQASGAYDKKQNLAGDSDDESNHSDNEYEKDTINERDFYDDLKVNEDDERALQMFQNKYEKKYMDVFTDILNKFFFVEME